MLAAAVAAPLIGELTRRFGLSIVVLELALGVAIGPSGLGWAAAEGPVNTVALYGMAFLFFLAGLEIDLAAMRGQALRPALLGWVVCFALGLALAYVGHHLGAISAWVVVGVALATTALGVLVPMLRDSGALETPFGRHVMAVGVVGELGPILAMGILLSRRNSNLVQSLLALAFVAIVIVVAWALVRSVAVPRFLGLLRRTMTQSSQLPVRAAVLLLAALVVLAETFGLDLALGALAAGMIVKLATQDTESHILHHKLDAIGFGFLVPVFFVASGMRLDLAAVFGSAAGMALTGVLFLALLVVRIPLVAVYRSTVSSREAIALGLYSATTLSLIVALTDIAVRNGTLRSQEASPLVMAGVLSVILLPLIAGAVLGRQPSPASRTYQRQDSL